ncbi:MAG: hypothetical protein IKO75_14510, partial [Bacteroidales bacterium]|nr:hypothetical protein [Bacteroidales bacterium]
VRCDRAPALLPALPGFPNTKHARFFAGRACRCRWVVAVALSDVRGLGGVALVASVVVWLFQVWPLG